MQVGRPMMLLAKMRVHLLRRNNYLIIYIIGAMTDGCRSYLCFVGGLLLPAFFQDGMVKLKI